VAGARRQAPEVEISVPIEPPVVGAALLALDTIAAPRVSRPVEEAVRRAMHREPAVLAYDSGQSSSLVR
jgi:hypothetical protein